MAQSVQIEGPGGQVVELEVPDGFDPSTIPAEQMQSMFASTTPPPLEPEAPTPP